MSRSIISLSLESPLVERMDKITPNRTAYIRGLIKRDLDLKDQGEVITPRCICCLEDCVIPHWLGPSSEHICTDCYHSGNADEVIINLSKKDKSKGVKE